MSITHHPSEPLLLDYATGALGEAWSLAVATHLALCPVCRRTVLDIEALGGSLLDAIPPEPAAAAGFDAVLARLDATPDTGNVLPSPSVAPAGPVPALPEPLRGYVGGDAGALPWKRLGLGAYHLPIATRTGGATARLLCIPAGRPVPTHCHRGLELTLVLCGAFSDATGAYARGDLQEADEDLEHQPHAAPGEDCICLAVTDAPLRFRSFAARMVQPLLGI
jgi:putative transcriptional regulator